MLRILIGILAITLAVHKSSASFNSSSELENNYGNHWLALLQPLTVQASELHNQLESEWKSSEDNIGRLLEATSGLQKQLEDRDGVDNVRFETIENLLENNTVLQKQDISENMSVLQKQLVSNDKELSYIKQVVIDQQNKIDHLIETSKIALKLQKGFVQIGSKYYYYGKNELTWSEALQDCFDLGAHLVSFENLEEMTKVMKKLNANYFWVDINESLEGVYVSQTTGLQATFIKWLIDEPNHSDSERCVEGRLYKSDYGFNDVVCTLNKAFICEL